MIKPVVLFFTIISFLPGQVINAQVGYDRNKVIEFFQQQEFANAINYLQQIDSTSITD